MIKYLSIIILATAFVLTPGISTADFYQYVDKDGVTHITNVPTSSRYKWLMGEKRGYSAKKASYSFKQSGDRFNDIIEDSASRHGIDSSLIKAVVKTESDFDENAVSVDGARGLMQLMPETARSLGVRDIHDPEENIEGGTRHLRGLLDSFNWDVSLALAAYNAGENAVLKYNAIPPYEETREYVRKVLRNYRLYKGYLRQ